MRRFAFGGALAVGLVSTSGLAQSTATYTGANNGNWNTPGNWNLGVVPINSESATFNAIIPTNTAVQFNVDGISTISGLNLLAGSSLNLSTGRQLTVAGVSVIAGMVNGTGPGTLFQANSPFASLQLNARAKASGGAIVRLGGLAYSCTGYDGDILAATGAGSQLDMTTFGSLSTPYDAGCCGPFREMWVRASSNGVIDLSAVSNVVGVSSGGRLRFREESGGKILLPNLVSSSGLVMFDPLTPLFALPSLQSVTTASILVAAGNTIEVNKLTNCTYSTITIADGGSFIASNLKIFDGSFIELNPQRRFDVPPLTSIHRARFRILGGRQFSFAATDYTTPSNTSVGDVFFVSGAGSFLDASSLTALRIPYNAGCCGSFGDNRVVGASGGVVNLSGVRVLQGPSSGGVLRVRAENGGVVHLNALQSTTGLASFEVSGANLDMPLLRGATSATFSVGVFDTINVPMLSEAHSCTFAISDGGTLNAPLLTIFDASTITLTPSRFFEAPLFTQIKNSRIFVREGKQFAVAATEYVNTGGPGDVFVADGFSSKLDLSTVRTFSAPYNSGCCGSYTEVVVRASNSADIDLSGLISVGGAVSGGLTRFDAVSGGTLRFGSPIFASGLTRVAADGTNSHLRFQSASLRASCKLSLTLVSNIHFTGNFDYNLKDETFVSLGDGKVLMEGTATRAAPQKLEVGCPDLGLPTGALAPNFQIGQLTVGRNGQPTNVQLVDEIDNGNRPVGQRERLYLQGFPAENGLRILGGSSLYIGDLELYAVIGNEWTRIRDLFAPGQTSLAFDEGRIVLGVPVPCSSDLNNDGMVEDADFSIFVVAYNLLDCADPAMPAGCPADLNTDGVVDDTDFTVFVVAYDALVCP